MLEGDLAEDCAPPPGSREFEHGIPFSQMNSPDFLEHQAVPEPLLATSKLFVF